MKPYTTVGNITVYQKYDHYELWNTLTNEFLQSCDTNELNRTLAEYNQ